jgi:molecular chaperone GrpE
VSDPHEPVTVTDKRRIDPETGEVRETATGPAPSGPGPAPDPGGSAAGEDTEAAELKATLQRVKAEYDNYRKRSVRQEQAAADRAKVAVVSQFLGVLDDLERARSHGDLESGPLRGVADKLTAALSGVGLTSFGAEGDDFDPSLHEAVQHEGGDSPGARPVLGIVMRQGYKLGDHLLRHAMVGVVDAVDVPDAVGNDSAAAPQPPESE